MNTIYKREEWKSIADYEDLYEVSCYGRIRNKKTHQILRTHVNEGYNIISLRKNGKKKNLRVARLVATAFVDNPEGLSEVNHINKDRRDDASENLEWCDRIYNVRYSKAKRVISTDENGETVIYGSVNDTGHYGYSVSSVYKSCINGKKYKGCTWRFYVHDN